MANHRHKITEEQIFEHIQEAGAASASAIVAHAALGAHMTRAEPTSGAGATNHQTNYRGGS